MIYSKYFVGSKIRRLKHSFNDQYVQRAKKQELRSRSWFKLEEIDRMDSLLRVGMTVVDLGSSPGGWSLYAKKAIGQSGSVIACDIMPMKNIFGVDFFQGDCTDINFLKMLLLKIKRKKVQVVLSDMSPNTTGISIIDINKSISLGNLALDICRNILVPGGTFVVKIFQGSEFDKYLSYVRYSFRTVRIRKPDSSRCRSREVYIVAKKYKKL